MSESKIEPRLARELDRGDQVRASGSYPVIVQLAVDTPDTELSTYETLAQRVKDVKPPVLERLAAANFSGNVEESVIAGSLTVELTEPQIRAIAELPQVKQVIWNRIDQVATQADSSPKQTS